MLVHMFVSGKHSSMYKVVQDDRGKTFQKTRVLYKHPLTHADANLEKVRLSGKPLTLFTLMDFPGLLIQ